MKSRSIRRRLNVEYSACLAPSDALKLPLNDGGIDIRPTSEIVNPRRTDALLVDLRPGALAGENLGATVKAARQNTYGTPLVFLVDINQYADPIIKKLIAIDRVVQTTEDQGLLIRTLRQAASAMSLAREYGVRVSAATSLGLPLPPIEPDYTPASMALFCEPSPASLELYAEISAHIQTQATISVSQTLQVLELRHADALCILPSKNRRQQSGLIKLLRRHGDLRDIPVIVFEPEPTDDLIKHWSGCGADDVFALHHESQAADTIGRLRKQRASSVQLGAQLRHAGLTTGGEAAALSSTRFFESCVFERMQRANAPMALAAVRLDADDGQDHRENVAEVAAYLSMAIRPEDLLARVAPNLFLFCLPDCDRVWADRMMDEVSRMIRDLKFGGEGHESTFLPVTHVSTSAETSNPAGLVKAAIRGLPKFATKPTTQIA